jgi:hypothetical protein
MLRPEAQRPPTDYELELREAAVNGNGDIPETA